jgi:peptidyl-prolyl cis-trans isomerase SurA
MARHLRRAAAVLVWLLLGTGQAGADIQPLDSIVAVVNNDVIVQSELNAAIGLALPELNARGTAIPSRHLLEKQVLERLILKRLQQQQAENLGIEVDDAALTEAMTSIAARNGMSLEQLRDTLEASGVSFEDFREDTRMQILTARLQQQEVMQKIRVSDAEVDRFLKQEGDSLIERREVRLQHILVATPDNPTSAQIEAARNKVHGATETRARRQLFCRCRRREFGRAARARGRRPGLVPDGRGAVARGRAAQTLAKGEVSEPIQSPSGFHLIRVATSRAIPRSPCRKPTPATS